MRAWSRKLRWLGSPTLFSSRRRQVDFPNPNGAASLRRAGKGGVALRAAVSANAEAFAVDLAPVLADIQAAGHISLRAIATELTGRGIRTRRGGKWGLGNVKGLLQRSDTPDRRSSTGRSAPPLSQSDAACSPPDR